MNFVSFETAGEAYFFSKNIPSYNTWVGISDQLVEGKFTNYYDGSITVNSLLNWIAGEPNNGGGNENCALVTTTLLYNDGSCNFATKVGCMSKF